MVLDINMKVIKIGISIFYPFYFCLKYQESSGKTKVKFMSEIKEFLEHYIILNLYEKQRKHSFNVASNMRISD